MTFSVPSAFAALTRASIPPRSAAEVAVAALLSPLLPESLDPQAARVSAAARAATAVRDVRRRTVSSNSWRRAPARTDRSAGHTGLRIVADRDHFRHDPERERVGTP